MTIKVLEPNEHDLLHHFRDILYLIKGNILQNVYLVASFFLNFILVSKIRACDQDEYFIFFGKDGHNFDSAQ